MGHSESLPPYVDADDRVILFDGVCRLCNAWCHFILKYDRQRRFKLASVQSREGQAILSHFELPTDHFDTMLYVEGRRAYERSDAFLRVVVQLGGVWKLLAVLRICPRVIRDFFYDRIALNRYRIFGRYDQCVLPEPDHAGRFLDADA
ncbi:thiol-disulfide oxidoreductase DCC family protein [Salinisphaera sp.]|uniref:thiol-disulfide oxidoreductase DCC family protein n=1 Tax=Salinisphaera sp. TaxID=1914330 RepID=UPI000C3D39D5|nr:thiol-disulfide oxidoreductase DCC family protein [Salinisphaera sp.]MBS63094.1 thiol-disulfide oxidoreductase [Salinisphaera sp.]